MNANCAPIVHFVVVMTIDSFKKKFCFLAVEIKYLLEWMIEVDVPGVGSIYKSMNKKVGTHFKPIERLMLSRSPNQALKEIRTA